MLPLAFSLTGRPVLVVGAGAVGARKATQLLEAGARVTVISDRVLDTLPEGIDTVHRRAYRPGDLVGYYLVVSATGRGDVNDLIVAEATREHVWLNVVDDPARSNFFFMALHRAGEVTLAVGTDGAAPALAQELRTSLAASLPEHVAAVAATLRGERAALHAGGETTEGRDWRPRIRELLDGSGVSGRSGA